MPMIDLYLPEDALDRPATDALVDGLTGALLRWMGAGDCEASRSISMTFVHRIPAGDLYVAGRPVLDDRYLVALTVPEGVLVDDRADGLVDEVTRLVIEAEGGDPLRFGARARVVVLVREIADGAWGVGGSVLSLRDMAAAVRAAEEDAREAAPVLARAA